MVDLVVVEEAEVDLVAVVVSAVAAVDLVAVVPREAGNDDQ